MTYTYSRNAIMCRSCLDLALSRHTHDLQRCRCGQCFADGGPEYLRRGHGDAGYVEMSRRADGQPLREGVDVPREAS